MLTKLPVCYMWIFGSASSVTREWHGCNPGYLGLYPYLYPPYWIWIFWWVWMGAALRDPYLYPQQVVYLQGMSREQVQMRMMTTTLSCKGNSIIVVIVLACCCYYIVGCMRMRVRVRARRLMAWWWQYCCARAMSSLLSCYQMCEDKRGRGQGEMRTMVTMTIILSCRGNKVIVVVVLLDMWEWGQGWGEVHKDEGDDNNCLVLLDVQG